MMRQAASRPPPGDLQPFRILIKHRINDMDEGFIAGEKAMPPGEQIAFEPAFAGVFAEISMTRPS